ncbi:MAG TPA: UPF0489 family protein [Bryobacteraceae bacterium]|nr:UPF0489 family protein [Bryobacteraceae bacterium]
MQTVLDLDLDFFVWPPFRRRPEEARLPRSEWKHLSSESEVRWFLERQCHLSAQTPVSGNEAEEHQEAFKLWRQWIDGGEIMAPFNVVHVDAHSDLGSGWGNRSCTFIETELLAMPIEQRRHPAFGPDHLNSGNYLLGAIANGWISQLTYVYPADRIESEPGAPGGLPRFEDDIREARLLRTGQEPPVSDLPAWIFQNGDWRTGLIELKHRPGSQDDNPPVHTEAPVPFKLVEQRKFSFSGVTHMFLAHSPPYTPVEADKLLPVVREYFHPV